MAADEATELLEMAEIERQVGHASAGCRPRHRRRQVALEQGGRPSHAAEVPLDGARFAVVPAGATTTPGALTIFPRPTGYGADRPCGRPCRERQRHSAPLSPRSHGIQNTVSTLCTSVGRPKMPDLRHIEGPVPRQAALAFDPISIIANSSPHMQGAGAAPQIDVAGRRPSPVSATMRADLALPG